MLLSLQICQRILFLIAVFKVVSSADIGLEEQQFQHEQQNDYETYIPLSSQANLMSTSKQYTPQESKQAFQQKSKLVGDGNILAAAEIAMEILNDRYPVNREIPNGFYGTQRHQQLSPKYSFDFSKSKHNFRKSGIGTTTAYSNNVWRRQNEQKERFFNNYNWHENANSDSNVARTDTNMLTSDDIYLQPEHYDINKETHTDDAINVGTTKIANDDIADSINAAFNFKIKKRQPQPFYPFAFFHENNDDPEDKGFFNNFLKLKSNKRERIKPGRTTYLPSISSGAMTHLGDFFSDLSKNVHFNEHHILPESERKLLEGDHPLRMLQDETEKADEQSKIGKTTQFLQTIRSYRPSQKIRSLVAMNPKGYHGSSFLDPNYMWVGLG